jgi:hypothetical protein
VAGEGSTSKSVAVDALADEWLRILDFERHWYRDSRVKARAIRDAFDCSEEIYKSELNAIIEHPGAAQYDPATVKRLRDLRRR